MIALAPFYAVMIVAVVLTSLVIRLVDEGGLDRALHVAAGAAYAALFLGAFLRRSTPVVLRAEGDTLVLRSARGRDVVPFTQVRAILLARFDSGAVIELWDGRLYYVVRPALGLRSLIAHIAQQNPSVHIVRRAFTWTPGRGSRSGLTP